MSADNYWLIREEGDRFAVSVGFLSDEYDPSIHKNDWRFDSMDEAMKYAEEQGSEYGVYVGECLGSP